MKPCSRTDGALQIARRLDWRFLLPEPQLRRVGYCGPENTSLARALAKFSASFEILSAAGTAGLTSSFDLIVLVAPALPQMEAASRMLAPAGYLYAEMQSAWGSLEKSGRLSFAQNFVGLENYITALQGLGFAEIKAYWHRPSFENAVQIIPVHDERALEYIFSQRAANLLGQLKLATGKSLLKTRWLMRWFQSMSLVACRVDGSAKL